MTLPDPSKLPLDNAVETKVISSTVSGGITAAVVTLVMYALGSIPFVALMPSSVQAALLVIVTGGVTAGATFVAGWLAKHTFRSVQVTAQGPVIVGQTDNAYQSREDIPPTP